jgi:pimeloyl-ACP methyl ester carboxylesterase
MCWERRIAEAAEWAQEHWDDLPLAVRRRVTDTIEDWVDDIIIPFHGVTSALEDAQEQLRQFISDHRAYIHHPDRLLTQFTERIFPRSRYGELARLLNAGSEPVFGTGEEIARPIILVPGMVGTRLFKTGSSSTTASSAPPDELTRWFEREFRSDDSDFLRPLSRDARRVLRPMLERLSERHLYDPDCVWDPDTPVSLVHLANKTAWERGELFCPDVTECAPAAEFAVPVAESMTLRGMFSLMFGTDAESKAREALAILGMESPDNLFEDERYEDLLNRRKRRGWCQPVWAVSEHWLLPLERTFNEVIYAFGYDWRRPLLESVDLLARKIERVKEAHDGKSPILVTHSFGGLLARAAAKRQPENVGGIVQVFSPTAGSVKPYVNFKKGGGGTVPPGWQAEHPATDAELSEFLDLALLSSLITFDPMDIGFQWILGWDATQFATSSAGAYGAYSLLPNNLPRYQRTGHWLNIEEDSALAGLLRSSRNVFDLYRQFNQPWGLLDGAVWRIGHGVTVGEQCAEAWEWLESHAGQAGSLVSFLHSAQQAGYLRVFMTETLTASQAQTIRDRINRGIEQAELLANYLGDWVHPNTWSLDATGRATDSGFNIRGTGDADTPHATHRIVTTDGDGSLEIDSARALSERFQGSLHFSDVNHAHAMRESPAVQAGMIKYVYFAMMAAHRAEMAT